MVIKSITSLIAVESIPTSSAAATTLKGSYATGLGHIGSTYPTRGKLKGAGMVLGSIGKLNKKSRNLI